MNHIAGIVSTLQLDGASLSGVTLSLRIHVHAKCSSSSCMQAITTWQYIISISKLHLVKTALQVWWQSKFVPKLLLPSFYLSADVQPNAIGPDNLVAVVVVLSLYCLYPQWVDC